MIVDKWGISENSILFVPFQARYTFKDIHISTLPKKEGG